MAEQTQPELSPEELRRKQTLTALQRGAQGCMYSDDARRLHELAAELESSPIVGGAARSSSSSSDLTAARSERDEARKARDAADERADALEKQLKDARAEIERLKKPAKS